MTESEIEIITGIQNSQRNIKITLGSLMGVTLLLFFFTFAQLVDHAPPIFFQIEIIITIIIVPSFFLLNRYSFFLAKLFKGRKYREYFKLMKHNDVDTKPEVILQRR